MYIFYTQNIFIPGRPICIRYRVPAGSFDRYRRGPISRDIVIGNRAPWALFPSPTEYCCCHCNYIYLEPLIKIMPNLNGNAVTQRLRTLYGFHCNYYRYIKFTIQELSLCFFAPIFDIRKWTAHMISTHHIQLLFIQIRTFTYFLSLFPGNVYYRETFSCGRNCLHGPFYNNFTKTRIHLASPKYQNNIQMLFIFQWWEYKTNPIVPNPLHTAYYDLSAIHYKCSLLTLYEAAWPNLTYHRYQQYCAPGHCFYRRTNTAAAIVTKTYKSGYCLLASNVHTYVQCKTWYHRMTVYMWTISHWNILHVHF